MKEDEKGEEKKKKRKKIPDGESMFRLRQKKEKMFRKRT